MFDWDKIVIEVDNNVVDLTAGEVALLIAADADTVTWGNITGDMTQQADLMLELDSKIGVDSPTFTGTPRTPTPPAGNISTRIANTEFVNGAVNAIIPEGGFGALANKNSVDYQTDVTNKPTFGTLASKNSVNYNTEVTNKPTLGTLASKNYVNYVTEVSNKPTFGSLASKNSVDYRTEVDYKPTLGSLASKNKVTIDDMEIDTDEVLFYVGNYYSSYDNHFDTIQDAIDAASPFCHTKIRLADNQAFFGPITIVNKDIELLTNNLEASRIQITNNDYDHPCFTVTNSNLKFTGFYSLYTNHMYCIRAIDSIISFEGSNDVKITGGGMMSGTGSKPYYPFSLTNTLFRGNLTGLIEIDYQDFEREDPTITVFDCYKGNVDLGNLKLDVHAHVVFSGTLTEFVYESITGTYSTLSSDTAPSNLIIPTRSGSGGGTGTEAYHLYVDCFYGDDWYHGTQEYPFKTISHAVEMAPNFRHTVIHVRAGAYNYKEVLIEGQKSIELTGYGASSSYSRVTINASEYEYIVNGVVTHNWDYLGTAFTVTGGANLIISGDIPWRVVGYAGCFHVNNGSHVIVNCELMLEPERDETDPQGSAYGYLFRADNGSTVYINTLTLRMYFDHPYRRIVGLHVTNASHVHIGTMSGFLSIDPGPDCVISDGGIVSYANCYDYYPYLNFIKRNGGLILTGSNN